MERMISYEDLKTGIEFIINGGDTSSRSIAEKITDHVYAYLIDEVKDLGNPNNWIAVINPEGLTLNARHNNALTFDNAVEIVFRPALDFRD